MRAYTVTRNHRSRSIRLRIDPDGSLRVTAPPLVPDFFIRRFVESQKEWIETHQEKVQKKKRTTSSEQITLFGNTYYKVIHTQEHTNTQPVVVIGNQLHLYPVTQSEASIERTLTTFLKSTAQKYIVPRTQQLATLMNITYTSLTLREQKTRWGSCSSLGGLNFNWRLVQYPPAVIDYVIVHELAHRREMNHSKRFWAIVAKYDPEYRSHRRWLQQHGSTVG